MLPKGIDFAAVVVEWILSAPKGRVQSLFISARIRMGGSHFPFFFPAPTAPTPTNFSPIENALGPSLASLKVVHWNF